MATKSPKDMTVPELRQYLKDQGHKNLSQLRKPELLAIAEGTRPSPVPSPRGRKKAPMPVGELPAGTTSVRTMPLPPARVVIRTAPGLGAAGVIVPEPRLAGAPFLPMIDRIRVFAQDLDVTDEELDRVIIPFVHGLMQDIARNGVPNVHDYTEGLIRDTWLRAIADAGMSFGLADVNNTEGLTLEQIEVVISDRDGLAMQLLSYIAGVLGV